MRLELTRPQWPRDFKQYLLLDYLITIFISELRFRTLKPVIKKTLLLRQSLHLQLMYQLLGSPSQFSLLSRIHPIFYMIISNQGGTRVLTFPRVYLFHHPSNFYLNLNPMYHIWCNNFFQTVILSNDVSISININNFQF